jgi:hypothetical protein
VWINVFGEEVDLDSIDREYALNIYTMAVRRRVEWWSDSLSSAEIDERLREDPLIEKLREVILKDAKKTPRDRLRAIRYNQRAAKRGLRWRANV